MIHFTKPFLDALPIIHKIEESGHQAYFVGGCVRDLLLHRQIGDVDITTSAKPDQIQELFQNVIPVGIEHGTVIVRHKHVSYEVTTFRVEGHYTDKRHPDSVSFIDKIDKDLERRDFTINALAMGKDGNIIDLFRGKEDLSNKIIRTVGVGEERLKEDPLRILRAIRFTSQLGFQLAEETIDAIHLVKQEIEDLAVERITKELEKLFAGDFVKNGLHHLVDLQLEEHIPGIRDYKPIQKVLDKIIPLPTLAEVVCLIHEIEPRISIKRLIKDWKCANHVWMKAEKLNQAFTYEKTHGIDNWLAYILLPDLNAAYSRLSEILLPEKIELDVLVQLQNDLPILSNKDLALNGHDIIEMFPQAKKGPWIKKLLTKMERLVVQEELKNEKSILKDWIIWNPPEVN